MQKGSRKKPTPPTAPEANSYLGITSASPVALEALRSLLPATMETKIPKPVNMRVHARRIKHFAIGAIAGLPSDAPRNRQLWITRNELPKKTAIGDAEFDGAL